MANAETRVATNYEVAMAFEMKKVVRLFHRLDTDQVALLLSHRRNARSQLALNRGEFFYSHPEIPNVAFKTRSAAARAALSRVEQPQ